MIASGVVVYVSCQPVDFRKGAASLMALVRDGGLDPFSGALHVFRSKRTDRVRIVWWDGSGVCLYSKTLEDHSFCWSAISAAHASGPRPADGASGRVRLEKDPSGQGQAAVIDGLKPACGKMNHAAGTVGKAAVFVLCCLHGSTGSCPSRRR
ncbi:IS66 family insertion sequence element accessory protein TnpB [Mesorhizobium sp. M0293]|uniref:IS66 family insertion sequence element accessory protein TnpB n=1 Tax=Mesorhizobium sp. M0293 TaxID=2956930 RepID=UPI00333CB3BE